MSNSFAQFNKKNFPSLDKTSLCYWFAKSIVQSPNDRPKVFIIGDDTPKENAARYLQETKQILETVFSYEIDIYQCEFLDFHKRNTPSVVNCYSSFRHYSAQCARIFSQIDNFSETEKISQKLTLPKNSVLFSDDISLKQHIPMHIFQNVFAIKIGLTNRNALISWLNSQGYLKTELCTEAGEYSLRGFILDIFPTHQDQPLRLEFYDETLESIKAFEVNTQRSFPIENGNVEWQLYPAMPWSTAPNDIHTYSNRLKNEFDRKGKSKKLRDELINGIVNQTISNDHINYWPIFTDSQDTWSRLIESAENTTPTEPIISCANIFPIYKNTSEQWESILLQNFHSPWKVYLFSKDQRSLEHAQKRLRSILPSAVQIYQINADISQPMYDIDENIIILDSATFYGEAQRRSHWDKFQSDQLKQIFLNQDNSLNSCDLIVHQTHGIGRYLGMVTLTQSKPKPLKEEFLLVEYADKDKLYLPVYRADLIHKYIGPSDSVLLDKLGATRFATAKAKIQLIAKDIAHDLVKTQAARKTARSDRYSVPEQEVIAFENGFPYQETPDQFSAIAAVYRDLKGHRLMDRLLCGDVGFGKTEVAMRAAYYSICSGKQVALLAPTSVLVLQHMRSFEKRFENFPFRLDFVSKLKTHSQIKHCLTELKEGKIDLIIGTHRLLSADIQFQNLGLIIVDEEHRFGVEHKEALKRIRIDCDILSLTATPIPRTLQMALTGLKDISILSTPPNNRKNIITEISYFETDGVTAAIEKEVSRGGQCFFLHNRIEDLDTIRKQIHLKLPQLRIKIAHGQMQRLHFETIMLDFYQGLIDVLISTTIIESGLDNPKANTIFINNAHCFGLSQLHQIRGRVGRSHEQAFCYLLVPKGTPLTQDANSRLSLLKTLSFMGAGFQLANHDLELRGAGNLFGVEQSGHIDGVGFELFNQYVQRAINNELSPEVLDFQESEKSSPSEDITPEIKIPIEAYIPSTYISSDPVRLQYYQRISKTLNEDDMRQIQQELIDRFGAPPSPVNQLMQVLRLKWLLSKYKIRSCTVVSGAIIIQASHHTKVNPDKITSIMQGKNTKYSIAPDSKVRIEIDYDTERNLDRIYLVVDQFFLWVTN